MKLIKILIRITNIIFYHFLLTSSIAFAESTVANKFKFILNQAEIQQKAENHKSAIKLYKKVYFNSNEFKREALIGLISSFKKSKQSDQAIEILKEEIKKNPFNGEYRFWLAEVYLTFEKLSDSLAEIEYAEKILGSEKSVLQFKSMVQQKLEKYQEAAATLTTYLLHDPNDYNILVDRAEIFLKQQLYAEAYNDFQKAYSLKPLDERIVTSYIKGAYFSKYNKEVKKVGQICLNLFPQNSSCLDYLGRSFFRKKDYAKASEYLKSAISIDPINI